MILSKRLKEIIRANYRIRENDSLQNYIWSETGTMVSQAAIQTYLEELLAARTVGKRGKSAHPTTSDPRLAAVADVARVQYGIDSGEVEVMASGSYLVFAEMAGDPNKRVQIMPDMTTDGFFVNPKEAHRVAMLALEQRECVRVRILKVKEIAPSFLKRERGPGEKLADETLLCSCSKQMLLRHGCKCGGV